MIEKKQKLSFYGVTIVVVILLATYLLFYAKCFGTCNTEIIKPLFVGTLGLLPTLIMLLFFKDSIFVSWLKQIAWWFLMIAWVLVSSNNHENDYSIFGDDPFVIGVTMTLLFVVTLVYALLLNRRLKKNGR